MKRVLIAGLAAVIAVSFAARSHAQTAGKVTADTVKWAEKNHKYVGEKACKTCHKTEYDSWALTKHAKAWATLKPEEQKKECGTCHMTGKTATDSVIVNVSCEACHGPGSEYKSMKNMKDHALAVSTGILPVTEAMCKQCHNKNSPNFKEFDFAKAKATGVHAMKPATPAK